MARVGRNVVVVINGNGPNQKAEYSQTWLKKKKKGNVK